MEFRLFLCVCAYLLRASNARSVQASNFVLTQSNLEAGRSTRELARAKRSPTSEGASVERFHVTSKITSRYSAVTIESVVHNTDDVESEVAVAMTLPKSAFISNFSMEINGTTYVGIIKKKAEAKATYDAAIARGESAGLVKANSRESQTFDVSVSVAAGQQVAFRLHYQELLQRKLGKYSHVIYTTTGQEVEDYQIEVLISEPIGITEISARPPTAESKRGRGSRDEEFDVGSEVDIRRSKTQARITYRPTVKQQRQLRSSRSDRSFELTYDVEREQLGGELLTRDGYFVHFLAPSDLPVIPKKVVFVIDTSGSMSGPKMRQTKTAMLTILDDLSDQDSFNIVLFDERVTVWKHNEMIPAAAHNIQEAKEFVGNIHAGGATNFYDAAMNGIQLLELDSNDEANSLESASMMIMLTDGQPSAGNMNKKEIRNDIRSRVEGRYSIFCLGFGRDLDYDLLKQISEENKGIARRIYQDSDAALQLKGFYDEVAVPLLINVVVNYSESVGVEISKISKQEFPTFFSGGEVQIVGRFDMIGAEEDMSGSQHVMAMVRGSKANGELIERVPAVEFDESFVLDASFDMEKIWAYLTIQQRVHEKSLLGDKEKARAEELDAEILRLALANKFVTPLTSMVVTKPNRDATENDTIVPRGNRPDFADEADNFRTTSRSGHWPPLQAARLMGLGSIGLSLGRSGRPPSRARHGYHAYITPPSWTWTTTTTMTTTTVPTTTTTTTTEPTTQPPTTTLMPRPTFAEIKRELPEFRDGRKFRKEVVYPNSTVTIQSPKHPGVYPPDSFIGWKIKAKSNLTSLQMTLHSLDMEKSENCHARDVLMIFSDVISGQNYAIPEFHCGWDWEDITPLRAAHNFYVVFRSDDVIGGRGFKATVTLV